MPDRMPGRAIGDGSGIVTNTQLAETAFDASKQTASPYNYDGCVVTIVDDDGQSAFLTAVKPVLDAKGVKCSLGVITNAVGSTGYMTKTELTELQTQGYEIVSHSRTHSSVIFRDGKSAATDAQIESEMKDSQQWLKDNGFEGFDFFVYPYGNSYGTSSDQIRFKRFARKFYRYAIHSAGTTNSSPVDNMSVNRYELDKNQNFTTVLKPIIDAAIAGKAWLVFLNHSGDSTKQDPSYLATVIDYLKTNNVPILPFGEAAKYKGNPISVGEFTDPPNKKFFVGNDGTSVGGGDYMYISGYIPTNGYAMDGPVTSYPDGKTSVIRVNNTSDNITSEGGNIHTYRTSPYYQYQMYVSATTGRLFTRTWNETGSWRVWVEFKTTPNNYNIVAGNMPTNGISFTSSITAYPDACTSVVRVNTTADTLTSEGGIMLTYRIAAFYQYQIFTSLTTGRTFFRSWNDGASLWRPWSESTTFIASAGIVGTMNDSIATYKSGQMKISEVDVSKDTCATPAEGGTLETYRSVSQYFSYQRFISATTCKVFYRKWTGTDAGGSWGTWKQVTTT